jgi:hypothetical protein
MLFEKLKKEGYWGDNLHFVLCSYPTSCTFISKIAGDRWRCFWSFWLVFMLILGRKALALEKIWSVADSDYELKKKRDAFLDFLELERKEELKAIFE